MKYSTKGLIRALAGPSAFILTVTALLSGCTTPQPSYRYMPPSAPSAPPPRVVVNLPVEAAQRQVAAALEDSSLEVVHSDSWQRVLVAHYGGDPNPYVDCGLLVMSGGQADVAVLPAAIATSQMTNDNLLYDRRMRLDGRLLVRFEPHGQQTVIMPEATYVLSKVVVRHGTDVWGRETIAFSSGSEGDFAKGATCHATGALEALAYAGLQEVALAPAAGPVPSPPVPERGLAELALSAVPEGGCAVLDAGRTGTGAVVVSGIASDLFTMDSVINALTFSDPDIVVENRLAVLSVPACEAYRLIQPYRADASSGLDLEIANLGGLAGGDDLRMALRLPPERANVHLVQFLDQGRVGQMELVARSLGGGATWSIDSPYPAGPPGQQSLVLAIATGEPLFAAPRPTVEPADAFLPALREALGRGGSGEAAPLVACAIVAKAAPGNGPAALGPSDPCW